MQGMSMPPIITDPNVLPVKSNATSLPASDNTVAGAGEKDEHERQMRAARLGMRLYHDALSELAK